MVLTMSVLSLALTMLSLAVPGTAAAAYSMLAIIETESRGPLDCGNRARGFEGTDVLYGLMDELAAPGTDTMTGGTAAARPIVIRKPLDRCSPPLFLALVGRERITRVEIQLFDNQGVHFFTIRMENVRVTRITPYRVELRRGTERAVLALPKPGALLPDAKSQKKKTPARPQPRS